MIESHTHIINVSDHHDDGHPENIVTTDVHSENKGIPDSEPAQSNDEHINQEEEHHY